MNSFFLYLFSFLSIPPIIHTPSIFLPLLFFLLAILVSSISTILPLPPIFLSGVINCLFFM
ncbi:hypothetical protein BC941DRAFT_445675 [Chlamydoabsidia padenii]|nr:hypothetical protein BC941DRAFT_445675 [Chlamydoabsidia padenii]